MGGPHRGLGYPSNAQDKSLLKKIKSILKRIIQKKPQILWQRIDLLAPLNLLKRTRWKKPQILRSRDEHKDVKKLVSQEGRKYGLTGYSLYDYYYFTEKGRRWASACTATPYSGYLLPFLNIGAIKATFSLTEDDRMSQAMHKYITAANSEGIDKIPYDTDLVSKDKTLTKAPYDENVFWRTRSGRSIMEKILNQDHYMWANLLNKSEINRMWEDHCKGKARHGEFFWRVAGFYFWYTQFSPYLDEVDHIILNRTRFATRRI